MHAVFLDYLKLGTTKVLRADFKTLTKQQKDLKKNFQEAAKGKLKTLDKVNPVLKLMTGIHFCNAESNSVNPQIMAAYRLKTSKKDVENFLKELDTKKATKQNKKIQASQDHLALLFSNLSQLDEFLVKKAGNDYKKFVKQ